MPGPLGSPESFEAKLAKSGTPPDPRRDLLHYLAGEFAAGEPMQLSSSEPDGTGRSLTDRMVSRLEVMLALKKLPYRQRRVIELRFVDGMTVEAASKRLGFSTRTFWRYQDDAIDAMAGAIYEWSASEVA